MRGWIPPLPLCFGMLAFGLSWVVFFEVARTGSFAASFLAFGWVHIVTLGWVTLIALAILLHVIPGFLDVEWRTRNVALWSTIVYLIGVIVLLAGFFSGVVSLMEWGATIACGALLVYGAALMQPLSLAMREDGTVRAVARAFAITFALLLATALLGLSFAFALGGRFNASVLAFAPQAHAILGIGGWMTMLVVGVSARTMKPIAGVRSRSLVLHIGSSTSLLVGTLVAAIGAAFALVPLLAGGSVLLLAGALSYALDIADILRRAQVSHRPPQALMAFAAAWVVAASLLLLGAAFGKAWGLAAVYAALIGWIGSAVLAHIHHIGVRVLITTIRGEDDETRPGAVLNATLSWTTVALFEAAALLGTLGILGDAHLAQVAAIAGIASFVTLVLNVATAAAAAMRLPSVDLIRL